jgi:hypothetical protein
VLLKNNSGEGHHWVGVRLEGSPSGRVERITDVPIDRYVTIIEGQGRIKA